MGLAHILNILSSKRARFIESMSRSSKRFRRYIRKNGTRRAEVKKREGEESEIEVGWVKKSEID